MKSYKIKDLGLAVDIKRGAVGVLPTDTLYGIVGRAESEEAVKKIYNLKERNSQKPFIILIGSFLDLQKFGIKPDEKTRKFLKQIWPGKVSVILLCESKKLAYLHRGKKSLAFRLPTSKNLIKLLKKTGPLVAPSANPEDKKPAETIEEAKKYFGKRVDFYVAGGRLEGTPSTILEMKDGKIELIREGKLGKKLKKFLKCHPALDAGSSK
ncbi:threonylcarbamoyl-AMP synthase [Patescibacteria group bacterium]|nr:threonylcarbamoyl-AMP synthase [Patescibacteria group bacterium]